MTAPGGLYSMATEASEEPSYNRKGTCLAPVIWPENGWPVVNGQNGTITTDMTCSTLPLKPLAATPARTDFHLGTTDLEWNYLRYPARKITSLTARKGYLRLKGSEQTIEDLKSPTFIGRRVRHLSFTASAQWNSILQIPMRKPD